jgi:phosphoglycolate phosphatase
MMSAPSGDPATMLPEAVLFDLDGTLSDPFEGITRSLEHALLVLGAESPSRRELAGCIGPPLRVTFARLLQTDEAATIERAVGAYRERYFDVGMYENQLYDGVEEMLRALRGYGCRIFLATSKVRPAAVEILRHFALDGWFDGVYGSEMDGRFDDKGELIEHLLAGERVRPETAFMVGDRMHDVVAARRNGVRPVGVTYGYGSRRELTDAGAEILCDTPAEVLGRLTGQIVTQD